MSPSYPFDIVFSSPPHSINPATRCKTELIKDTLRMQSYSLNSICIPTSSQQTLVRCWTISPCPLRRILQRHSTSTGEVVTDVPSSNKKKYGQSRTLTRPRNPKLIGIQLRHLELLPIQPQLKLKRRSNSNLGLMKVNYGLWKRVLGIHCFKLLGRMIYLVWRGLVVGI